MPEAQVGGLEPGEGHDADALRSQQVVGETLVRSQALEGQVLDQRRTFAFSMGNVWRSWSTPSLKTTVK